MFSPVSCINIDVLHSTWMSSDGKTYASHHQHPHLLQWIHVLRFSGLLEETILSVSKCWWQRAHDSVSIQRPLKVPSDWPKQHWSPTQTDSKRADTTYSPAHPSLDSWFQNNTKLITTVLKSLTQFFCSLYFVGKTIVKFSWINLYRKLKRLDSLRKVKLSNTLNIWFSKLFLIADLIQK